MSLGSFCSVSVVAAAHKLIKFLFNQILTIRRAG